MGLKECLISLENPWNTYYAGQTINGQATFTFDSPKKVRGKCNQRFWLLRRKWARRRRTIRRLEHENREERMCDGAVMMSIVVVRHGIYNNKNLYGPLMRE